MKERGSGIVRVGRRKGVVVFVRAATPQIISIILQRFLHFAIFVFAGCALPHLYFL